MRQTPLRSKRPTPRVKRPERVSYTRIKPKAGAEPTAEEKRHIAAVAAMPCLVCRKPSTVHHVTASIYGGRIARSHRRVVPLCPVHHQIQHGNKASVEYLGHGGFHALYGVDLLATADRLWERR